VTMSTRDLLDRLRSQANRVLDLDVVRSSGQHTLRTHTMKILRDYAIDTVIDVGASEGGYGSHLRRLGFGGEIYSFEPVREAFEKLTAVAARDGKWTTFNLALGAHRRKATINVSRFSQLSSFLPASAYGASHWENMKVVHHQEIEISTLDDCLRQELVPARRRYLLKMDTQGFDLEVFKGAETTIPEICCMLSELSLIPLYEGAPHYLDALALYGQSGFSVSGFYPITRNQELALNEVDCMMVNMKKRTVAV
jgi:FkbM family methyltransferase